MTIASVGISCATCFYFVHSVTNAELPQARRFGFCCADVPAVARGGGRYAWPWVRLEEAANVQCGRWASDQEPPPHMGLAEVPGGDT